MDSLFSLLTNLQLQSAPSLAETENFKFETFTLFPNLPTELRLKIISHALPTRKALKLAAEIVIADPSFGLYLSFHTINAANHPPTSFTSNTTSEPSLKSTQHADLLLVNKEFREYYLENFPLTLPTGLRGVGQIRYAPSETIFITNFGDHTNDPDVLTSMVESYRLQTLWEEIEILGIFIGALLHGRSLVRPAAYIIKHFRNLKEVRVYMWEGFEDQVHDELASQAIRNSMEMRLQCLKLELEVFEHDEGYVVPRIVLV